MANPGTVIAHIVKLVTTIICMKFFNESFSLSVTDQIWAVRAFQLLFAHSIVGILRYGGSSTTKRFRHFYELLTSATEVVPLTLFASEVLLKYRVQEELRYLLLAIGLAPSALELGSTQVRPRERIRIERLVDFAIGLQAFCVGFVCLWHANYAGLSLAASFAVTRYVSEDFCDQYEVPHVDLAQYSLGFVELFALATIKEL